VLDLGGGSLQLSRVVGRLAREERSWKLGAVRMTERFGDDRKALRKHVASKIDSVAGGRLVAIGGTARNLAAADQVLRSLPSFGVQGHVIPRDALAELVDELAGRSPAERAKLRGIKPERGDIILAGAQTILSVLDIGGFDGVEVTEAGLREGVFFSRWLEPEELFDDVRRQSVLNLAGLYHVDHAHTEHVARLALGLFDELAAAGLHDGDAVERELLWAAAALHDIGMTVDYDDHHKHSRYLVLNGGLPGFSPREVALIGQAVRYHRKGTPGLGPFGPLMHKGDQQLLLRLSVLLRLAEDLERPRDQLVQAVDAVIDGERVELRLQAEGDVSVSRWAAARETDLFASAFGRELVV
jgi:exopolyphosphatase / guanosine-5'-triphosphate,3'-diphosphate pyrophosphatase